MLTVGKERAGCWDKGCWDLIRAMLTVSLEFIGSEWHTVSIVNDAGGYG